MAHILEIDLASDDSVRKLLAVYVDIYKSASNTFIDGSNAVKVKRVRGKFTFNIVVIENAVRKLAVNAAGRAIVEVCNNGTVLIGSPTVKVCSGDTVQRISCVENEKTISETREGAVKFKFEGATDPV